MLRFWGAEAPGQWRKASPEAPGQAAKPHPARFALCPASARASGSVAEWSIAPVLKTGNGQPFVSSNLTASANNEQIRASAAGFSFYPSSCPTTKKRLALMGAPWQGYAMKHTFRG